MFFKYQFGKQYVYAMDASAPDNLKISLKIAKHCVNGTLVGTEKMRLRRRNVAW